MASKIPMAPQCLSLKGLQLAQTDLQRFPQGCRHTESRTKPESRGRSLGQPDQHLQGLFIIVDRAPYLTCPFLTSSLNAAHTLGAHLNGLWVKGKDVRPSRSTQESPMTTPTSREDHEMPTRTMYLQQVTSMESICSIQFSFLLTKRNSDKKCPGSTLSDILRLFPKKLKTLIFV
ncbi:hypothetical protein P7K49_008883 [Saguinus oedipus]|uniref:Uncharacterized protein n=1 Tax=Saguinus oedipus TaxID=9490 RepID=A0ABQ9VZ01_SAGOE|nr:hypothetical protein P7K49_008883 [Saguinus oedipus]